MADKTYRIYRTNFTGKAKELSLYAECTWSESSSTMEITLKQNEQEEPEHFPMTQSLFVLFNLSVKMHAEKKYKSYQEINADSSIDIYMEPSSYSTRKNEIKNGFLQAGIDLFEKNRGLIISDKWFIVEKNEELPSLTVFFRKQNIMEQTISRMRLSYQQDQWEPAFTIGADDCREKIEETFLNGSKAGCSLIIGDGGAGKTNLIKILDIVFKANAMNVYLVSLAHLLQYSQAHPVHNPIDDVVDRGGLETNRYNSYLAQYLKFQQFPSDGTIFLFDGFNEMLDMVTNENGRLIEKLCQEIGDLCRKNVYKVIISTRNAAKTKIHLPNILFSVYRPEPLNVEIDPARLPNVTEAEKNHIIAMLRTPLFYNIYRSLSPDEKLPGSQYGIMKKFFAKLFEQSVTMKDGHDNFVSRCLYFLMLPLIAHKMHLMRTPFLSLANLTAMIEEMNQNASVFAEWINYCTKEMGISSKMIRTDYVNTAQAIAEEAIHTSLIQYDESEKALRFIHQEWHEFFSAYYVISYLCLQKRLYADGYRISTALASEFLMPSFNLPTCVQKTIGAQLNLLPASMNNTDDVNQARADAYVSFFAVDTDNLNQTQGRIEDGATLLFTAYELSDHFMLHHWMAPQALAGKFFREIILPNASPELFSEERTRLRYCKSLAALMESDRRIKNYKEIAIIYETVMKTMMIENCRSSTIGEKMLTYRILFHQYAKATLFEGKDILKNAQTNEKKTDGRKQIREAMHMLWDNRAFNMSANLLGCMNATPNSFLIRELDMKSDVKKAAEVYAESFASMTSKELSKLTGTELLYTGRSYLNLAVKTYIRWNGDSWEDNGLEKNQEIQLPTGDLQKDSAVNTFSKIKFILDHLEGQDSSFLNWDRAMFRIYKAFGGNAVQTEQYEADAYLLSEKENIMTAAVRLAHLPDAVFCQDQQERTQTVFFAVKEDGVTTVYTKEEEAEAALGAELSKKDLEVGKADAFDATDQYYYLQDLERLCLVLKKMAEENSRIHTAPLDRILTQLGSLEHYQTFKQLLAAQKEKVAKRI